MVNTVKCSNSLEIVCLLDYPLGCSQDYGGSVNLVNIQKLIIVTKDKIYVKMNAAWS